VGAGKLGRGKLGLSKIGFGYAGRVFCAETVNLVETLNDPKTLFSLHILHRLLFNCNQILE